MSKLGYLLVKYLELPCLLTLDEALAGSGLAFVTSDENAWYAQTYFKNDGDPAARCASVAGSKESWVETSVIGAGKVVFWEACNGAGDFKFTIDGVTKENAHWSGGNWNGKFLKREYTISTIGEHKLRWSASNGGGFMLSNVSWITD